MFKEIKPGGLLAAAIILAIAYAARDVVTPLLCSFLAAFVIEPLVARIDRKTGRKAAVAITLLMLAVGIGSLLIFFVPKAAHEAWEAAEAARENISTLNSAIRNWLVILPEDVKQQAADALATFGSKILSLMANAVGIGVGFLGGVVSAISKGLLFLTGFIFFMLDFPLLKPGFMNVLAHVGCPADRISKINDFLEESNSLFRSFFRGQLLYALALGTLTAIGLWTIGLQYALTVGIAVGILSLVPYVGVAVGLLVALAISFHYDGRIVHLALTVGVFGGVQFIDAIYLTPKLLGSSVGIHPLLAVVSLLAFAQLFGFFGLMLAIPLAAVTLAALRRLLAE